MSPLFDGNAIFTSTDIDGDPLDEGDLVLGDYDFIKQTLHFNGELGNRYLFHGAADRQWVFKGYLTAQSLDDLHAKFRAIEKYIDNSGKNVAPNVNGGTYYTMSDSYGNAVPYAQIHNFHKLMEPRACSDGTYTSIIQASGILIGMEQEG